MQFVEFQSRTINPNTVLEVGPVETKSTDTTIDSLEQSLGVLASDKSGSIGFTITCDTITDITYQGYATNVKAETVRNGVITKIEQGTDHTRAV